MSELKNYTHCHLQGCQTLKKNLFEDLNTQRFNEVIRISLDLQAKRLQANCSLSFVSSLVLLISNAIITILF